MSMVRVGSPPDPPRPAAGVAWLLPAVFSLACSVAAVVMVDADVRVPLGVGLAVATVAVAAACAEASRRGRRIRGLRAQRDAAVAEQHSQRDAEAAALRRRLAAQEAALLQLTEEMLPKTILRLQQGESAREIVHELGGSPDISPEFAAAQRTVLRSVAEAVEAEEGMRDSAQRAFVNIARRVQAIVHQQATDLREMEERHGATPDVFGDLLRLDHGTALIGRLADSIAVLGGARPGRQWQNNVALYSVLRGAISRITDYPRVELASVAEVAVVGSSVEPLIHALAELLDNATRYSPPKTLVRVTASEVQSGVAIEIEDGGIGLAEEARRRVERLLEEASAGLDLTDLGESPRLGLAVVGRLAQQQGFRVSLRPSAYGGVRAILIVPTELLTSAPISVVTGAAPGLDALPAARTRTLSSGTTRGAASPKDDEPMERTPNGLPQRRRRTSAGPPRLASVPPSPRTPAGTGPATASAPAGQRGTDTADAPEPGLWLAAFQDAVSGESPGSGTADSRGQHPDSPPQNTPAKEGER
ncbi:ATP-binding protein [Yinghuangia seranimata]|uniref:ATP-binding protein n=1 Tax=Yinghuangia seranimata TaxID=408067 RepID=UPI00248B9F53|nr:ATP-binding protein [Yinghuangia seranimata]MDI2130042.1 ATP-binding protein [Yinghuangia seranimata]